MNKGNHKHSNNNCCCAEDDNCGCTYPENIAQYENLTNTDETVNKPAMKHKEAFVKDGSVCYCSPDDCDCKIEYK